MFPGWQLHNKEVSVLENKPGENTTEVFCQFYARYATSNDNIYNQHVAAQCCSRKGDIHAQKHQTFVVCTNWRLDVFFTTVIIHQWQPGSILYFKSYKCLVNIFWLKCPQCSEVEKLTAAKMQHLQHGCGELCERCIYDSREMDITAVVSLSFTLTSWWTYPFFMISFLVTHKYKWKQGINIVMYDSYTHLTAAHKYLKYCLLASIMLSCQLRAANQDCYQD